MDKRFLGESGFSFIDILVVMTIMAILAAAAVPQFKSFSGAFDRFNARSYLIQDLKQAQAQAITQGCREIFAVSLSGKSYSFGCDYLAYDTNDPPQADVVSFSRNLPGDVIISSTSLVIFNSRGHAVDISGAMADIDIVLAEQSDGSPHEFASGTLFATGVFVFDQEEGA